MSAEDLVQPVLDAIWGVSDIVEDADLDADNVLESHEVEVGDYTANVEVRWSTHVVDNGFSHAFGYEQVLDLERYGKPELETCEVLDENGECEELSDKLYNLLVEKLK